MTPEPTPTWPTDHIISKLEAIAGGLGQPGSIAPAISQACDEAATRLRELAAAKGEMAEIFDLFGIGSAARCQSTLLTNIRNVMRRSDCLGMVESHHSFRETDDEGEEIDVCPLSWADEPERYRDRYESLMRSDKEQASRLAAALEPLYEAARGLSFGDDWNKGTQALAHGYRQKLLDAIPAAAIALDDFKREGRKSHEG